MRRFLLAVVAALPLLQAREVESGLAALRRQLRSHPVVLRTSSGPHHRAALASGTLAETVAALESIEGPGASGELIYLRERLLAAGRKLEADFASIEARLAGLGFPEKTAAWHEFVRHYRARLAEVEGELARLADGSGSLGPGQLRARLAALRTKFGSRRGAPIRRTLDGDKSPGWPEASPAPADDLPGPADLADSRVVLLTAEIRQQAQALGGSPAGLNAWVATHVEYEPYLGLMQNSLAVLTSGRGNDFDQATLLVALLRSSGIPARYVCADTAMSRAEVRDWMGVKDESVILGLLSRGLGYSLFPTVERDRVVATRVWVEAYFDTGSGGKRWMVLDPARKRRSYQPGILLPRPPYDRTAYLRALKPAPPSELYLDALRAEFQKSAPGRGFAEVPYLGTPLPPDPPSAEPPHPVVKLQFRSPAVPATLQHRINLSLSGYATSTQYLSVDLILPEVVLQSISLVFNPATAADRAVVEAFGGLESAPAAVVNLIPEFRLQGQTVATGKTPVAAGAALDLTVTHLPVAQGATRYANRNQLTAGETAAVVIGAHQVSAELLANRISSFLDRLPSLTAAQATSRLLDVAAMRYLHRLENDKQQLSDFLQVRFLQAAGVENAIAFATLETQNLFDRPYLVTPGRLRIHANPTSPPLVDLNRSDQDGPVLKAAWQLHNDASSVLEHEVWEELVLIPSVSTMKILQTAVRDGVPIRTISRGNAADLAGVEAPASAKQGMQQAINAGATLTVPARPVTIGSWRGQGWIEEDASNWNNAYRIIDAAPASGGLAPGGDTGGTPPPPRPPQNDPGTGGKPGPVNNTTSSDPVNVANGNLFEQTTDYALATLGPAIAFQRTYTSLSLADGPLGPGWKHSYQVSLKDSGSAIVIQDASGAVLNFRLAGGAYVSPPGYNLTLIKDAQGYLLRTGKGVESRFDSQGALQSVTDRNQNAIRLTYEAGRLRRVTDRAGRGITLNYDSRGRITTLEDFRGRRVAYEFDSAGHLAASVDVAGNRTVYAYYTDSVFRHLLKSVTTPGGSLTSFQYYANGKVARVTLPGGQEESFLYLPLRNETHVVDGRGGVTSYQYNALGNVTRIVRPDGNIAEFSYSADAKLLSRTDETGSVTRYARDANGNLTSYTDALGHTTSVVYEPRFNRVVSLTDPAGAATRFEYDSRGNLLRAIAPEGVETRYTYDSLGQLATLTDGEGNTWSYKYDAAGNRIEATGPLGDTVRNEFDELGRPVSTTDALGRTSRFQADALNRATSLIDPAGNAVRLSYDANGNLAEMTGPGGQTTRYGYDVLGGLKSVASPLGGETRFDSVSPECHCTAGPNVTSYADAAGGEQRFVYDSRDRLVETTIAGGGSASLVYDAAGRLVKKVNPSGKWTTFDYDAASRLVRKTSSDGGESKFSYDSRGNLTRAANAATILSLAYDRLNRLTGVTDSRGDKTLSYAYDRNSRRTALVDSEGGTFGYAYDRTGRLVSLTNPSGASAQFRYDAGGRLTDLVFSNGASASWRYDAAGRPDLAAWTSAAGTPPFPQLAYTYDESSSPVTITDSAGVHSFRYDALNRLTGATHPSQAAESYAYDADGNRTASAGDPQYRYGAAGLLSAAEGATYTYDDDGNLAERRDGTGVTTYSYNSEGQLTAIAFPGGATASYQYDALGRRIEKNVNGAVTRYVYDGEDVLLEMDGDNRVRARYTHGPGTDQPLVLERDGAVYFYHADPGGNILALTDQAGRPVRSWTYDSFGRISGFDAAAQPATPYAFAGREYDAESGLYYLRARYYDASIGRFLSPDPLDLAARLRSGDAALLRNPQELNPYSYALNNPLAFRDPSGLKPVTVHMWPTNPWGSGTNTTVPNLQQWLDEHHYRLEDAGGGKVHIVFKTPSYEEDPKYGYSLISLWENYIVGTMNRLDVPGNVEVFTPEPGSGGYVGYVLKENATYLRNDLKELGQILSEKSQASLKVNWHRLSWKEYWDAMDNPEKYVER